MKPNWLEYAILSSLCALLIIQFFDSLHKAIQ